MKIGFTGARKGMTIAQQIFVEDLLVKYLPEEVHHGDCVGADAQFDEISKNLKIRRVIHPPDKAIYRAFCRGEVILPEKPYLVRNHDIVNAVEVLLACPAGTQEFRQSGTWATVRYARAHVPLPKVVIVFPDGVTRWEK